MKITSTKFKDIFETIAAIWMKKDPNLAIAYTLEETPRLATIYFLCDDKGTILYIGQSKNIGVRMAQHESNAKMIKKLDGEWAKTYYIQQEIKDEKIRLRWEAVFILLCNPRVNQALALRKAKVGTGWHAIRFGNNNFYKGTRTKRPANKKNMRY